MIRCESPELTAPDGSIIAVIEEGSARISAPGIPCLTALPSSPGNFLLDGVLERLPRVERTLAVSHLVRLRGAGATCILTTHDEGLMSACADEIWWMRDGHLIARGDPAEVLAKYRAHCAARIRAAGEGVLAEIAPSLRTGDGRASLENIELTGESGAKSVVFRSGEPMTVSITVRFAAAIATAVIGILIRTRIGLNVYGTNTELEGIQLGPLTPGDAVLVRYAFPCDLCPGDYTITAASHDPAGIWHDWLEDAVAFGVSDTRYTAGVANLRARVEAVRISR
jgi:lipopolysaccharide transport system ATP-binding protein